MISIKFKDDLNHEGTDNDDLIVDTIFQCGETFEAEFLCETQTTIGFRFNGADYYGIPKELIIWQMK